MTVRPLFLAAALTMTALVCETVLAFTSPPPKSTVLKGEVDDTETISAPVYYKNTMLIVINSDGIAAIVFGDQIELGTKYRYRYLKHGTDEEVTGEGSVFEKYTDGKYAGGTLNILAGDVSIEWSRGGNESGWIYYQPEKMRVQIASAARFEKEPDRNDFRDSRSPLPKINLKRFRNQP